MKKPTKNLSNKKLDGFSVQSMETMYSIKNRETGKYVSGLTWDQFLEHVPGKKRKQRVCRRVVCETTQMYLEDNDEINKQIKTITEAGLGAHLDLCDLEVYECGQIRRQKKSLSLDGKRSRIGQLVLLDKLKKVPMHNEESN